MTAPRTSHDPPLMRPATAPPSLLGGSLLVSALAQFSLSADKRCQPGHHPLKTLTHKPFHTLHPRWQTLRHCGWQATGKGISPAETARASGSQRQIKGGKSARFRLAKPVQG